MGPRLLIIEDVHESHGEIEAAYQSSVRPGSVIPRPVIWSHRHAASAADGSTEDEPPSRFETVQWSGDEVLMLDCLDRNAVVEPSPPNRSEFASLALLSHLRGLDEAGAPIPRTIVYSRGLASAHLRRAVLSEFMRPRAPMPHTGRVKVTYRSVLDPPPGHRPILSSMHEYDEVLTDLPGVVMGTRAGLSPPGPGSVVYREAGPRSCLASFHEQLRAGRSRCLTPEEWTRYVLAKEPPPGAADAGLRRRVQDAEKEFLQPTGRGPTWRTWVRLLREIAIA